MFGWHTKYFIRQTLITQGVYKEKLLNLLDGQLETLTFYILIDSRIIA